MTQEEKELLLKDLSARLPYGVEVYYSETVPISTLITINSEKGTCIAYDHSQWYRNSKFYIEEIKPYLRPLSHMTEEERNEYLSIKMQETERVALAEVYRPEAISEIMDWLNKHHFDYRGLIGKGIAIEVTEENNPYK